MGNHEISDENFLLKYCHFIDLEYFEVFGVSFLKEKKLLGHHGNFCFLAKNVHKFAQNFNIHCICFEIYLF